MTTVIVRYPPSPTGLFHIGTARTCLFNYLFAKQHGGKIIYRLEDTDKERSTKMFEENISEGIVKLGLHWDEGPYHQSERTTLYTEHLKKLLESGKAYYCFCSKEELDAEREKRQEAKLPPRYSGKCRDLDSEEAKQRVAAGEKAVIRFRVPENTGDIVFQDLVRGKIVIHAKELDDFVIAKDLETPLYHLTVVVDDHEMKVSHVIRGEDHISNTPKQMLLFQAFEWETPIFAHLPLILNEDKSKLSKRKNDVAVDDYLKQGILPDALVNYLALLGWNTSDEQEMFSREELIKKFDLTRVQKGGAIFDREKLLWINAKYIQTLPEDAFVEVVTPFLERNKIEAAQEQWGNVFLSKAIASLQPRIKLLSQAQEALDLYLMKEEDWTVDPELLPHKKMKVDLPLATENLKKVFAFLGDLPAADFDSAEGIQENVISWIAEQGQKNGQVLWPLRVALSNAQFSPSPFEILSILGKERGLRRIKKALEIL